MESAGSCSIFPQGITLSARVNHMTCRTKGGKLSPYWIALNKSLVCGGETTQRGFQMEMPGLEMQIWLWAWLLWGGAEVLSSWLWFPPRDCNSLPVHQMWGGQFCLMRPAGKSLCNSWWLGLKDDMKDFGLELNSSVFGQSWTFAFAPEF